MSIVDETRPVAHPPGSELPNEVDLRIPATPIFLGLLVLGPLLYLFVAMLPYPREVTMRFITLSVALQALAGAGWLLARWNDRAGRWAALSVLTSLFLLLGLLVRVPGALALLGIPVALALPLIGIGAAIATAIGESLLLVGLLAYPPAGLDPPTVVVALTAAWAAAGVACLVYRPIHQLAGWIWTYFEHAQTALEEARDRKGELEQALDDLAHANRQLMLASERTAELRAIAEEAQRAKTAFVANVSHEFRTPLNMIIGLVELMVETPEIYAVSLSADMRDDLSVVYRNCEHLANLVNDVLDLTRMEAGQMALHRERIDLREVIADSATTISPLLEKKRLALEIYSPEGLPRVYCDRTRIQQVVLNLLSNAARFTEAGGITVDVTRNDRHVTIRVVDTGPGIVPEDARSIFEPFCQGRSDLWRNTGGSGLGLSISEQFVKLHGGRMWLESELGVGSTFFIELPISGPLERAARPGHLIREDWVWVERRSRADLSALPRDPRVVVYDEMGKLCGTFARYFSEVEFVDAGGLSDVAGEAERCPAQAVVLNATTPEAIWSLVQTVRQGVGSTPIIGCSVPLKARRAAEAGALGHLVKPVARATLAQALETVGHPVRRVLIVDDDADAVQLFRRMLEACDETLKVVTASSGAEALERLRCQQFDLMLLDIVMPDMDGWQVLEAVRGDETLADVPTLFVSAQDPA